MVKSPKIRHSKTQRDPVTIELEPGAVSRVEDNREPASATSDAGTGTASVSTEDMQDAARTESPDVDAVSSPESNLRSFDEPEGPSEAASSKAENIPEDRTAFGPSEADEASAPPAAPRRQGTGGFSALAAGLIGGIVALAGAGGLQYAGVLPSPSNGGDAAAVSAALQSEIATLKDQIAGIGQSAGSAEAEGVRQALGESASRVDGLTTALDQVKADVASLKSAVETGGAGENAGLQALQDKIAEIERSVAALGQAGASAPPADMTAISDKLAALETAVNAATTAASANDGRIGTVEKGLGTLEQNVAALTGKVDAQASQPKVALAIAVSALKTAVEGGGPFASEVETFAAVAPNAPELPELRSIAEKGVPSRDEIAAEVSGAAGAMIDAGRTVDENAGYFQRLLSSAGSLIKVRPVGPVEGAGVPETVARLEASIDGGDYAKAVAEYDMLPEASKAAGLAFMEKVRARLAAEQLVEKATAGALKA